VGCKTLTQSIDVSYVVKLVRCYNLLTVVHKQSVQELMTCSVTCGGVYKVHLAHCRICRDCKDDGNILA